LSYAEVLCYVWVIIADSGWKKPGDILTPVTVTNDHLDTCKSGV